jgi:hypothetical protein
MFSSPKMRVCSLAVTPLFKNSKLYLPQLIPLSQLEGDREDVGRLCSISLFFISFFV